MKQLRYILYALAVIALSTACQDEYDVADTATSGQSTRVTGSLTNSADTRLAYTISESSVACAWAAGDTIALFSSSQTTPVLYVAKTDSTTTEFEALSEVISVDEGDTVYAWAPYQVNGSNAYPKAALPSIVTQSYSGGTVPAERDFVYASAQLNDNELSYTFNHLLTFLRISVYPQELSGYTGLVITSTENIAYADGATYDIASDNLTATWQTSIVYTIDDTSLSSARKLHCYVAMLPISTGSTLTINPLRPDGTTGKALLTKTAPLGGLRAGRIYATTIESANAERYALEALYEATNGDGWTDNTNWGTDVELSDWYGVMVNGGHVTGLQLYYNNLTGELPEEIGNLANLQSLYLYLNDLSGEIPESIGNLTELTTLSLSINSLTGSIPECIGNLTKLNTLVLNNNSLTGSIPESIGNLTELTTLNLNENSLTGSIPESIGNLTELTTLNLYDNDLTGNLPIPLANLTSLTAIQLRYNKLSGLIPDEIVNCKWWQALDGDWRYITIQKSGYYLSLPFAVDCEYAVHTLQEHTKGKGIKIVLFGECFTQALIDDGSYAVAVEQAHSALFAEEPFTTYKDYFDVYYVDTPSNEETPGGDTFFYPSYIDTVQELLLKMKETNYTVTDVTAAVIVNRSTSMRSCTSMFLAVGHSVAYCLYLNGNLPSGVFQHEVIGHGFGSLGDEYVENSGSTAPTSHKENVAKWQDKYGAYTNVDSTSDPDEIAWSYFLSDSRYQAEGIGIYEGAYYQYGMYRSTENSIMRYNTGGFNAPSRHAIYKRIMELSGETYTFEGFLEYDEVNRQAYASGLKTRAVDVPIPVEQLGMSPVIVVD